MHFDPDFLIIFPVLVLSIVVHECAHGLVALWCGDPTARDQGRLTLNPLPHVDPVGSLLLPGLLLWFHAPVCFGWAKPVPVNWAQLRHPRDDQLKVALAGPASNALLAMAFAVLARVAPTQGFFAPLHEVGLAGVVFNCALGLFNLIPIPPLDGSWVLMRFLKLRHILLLHQFRFLGLFVVAAMLASRPVAHAVFYTPLSFAVRACLGLVGLPAGEVVL